jgi:hypothetical protein
LPQNAADRHSNPQRKAKLETRQAQEGSKASVVFVETDKPYKLYDTKGLYLEVDPSGGKYWRFKYKFPKEKRISLGVYPEMSLADARDLRDEKRKLLSVLQNYQETGKPDSVAPPGLWFDPTAKLVHTAPTPPYFGRKLLILLMLRAVFRRSIVKTKELPAKSPRIRS